MAGKIIQLVLGVTIAGGIAAYTAKDRANTFEEYGLSGPTLKFAQSCDSSMRRYDLKFKQGSKNHAGCACMAKEISANIEDPDYDYLATNFSNILKARSNSNDKDAVAALILESMTSGKMDDVEDLMQTMGYMMTCSNRSSEQEIRQTYIEDNPQTGSLEASDSTTSTRSGLRSNSQQKPTGKCAELTEKQIAQRIEGAKEAGLHFDRATCKMYSL